jgi:hypothetical protein
VFSEINLHSPTNYIFYYYGRYSFDLVGLAEQLKAFSVIAKECGNKEFVGFSYHVANKDA